jgi:Mrp family chromosome partitioning ATPase
MLRTNLTFRGVAQNHRTIVVTSSGPNDGKSTLVSNLAISFATMGKRVLLIDAELRRPGMHIVFNVPEGPGLGELLTVPGSATSRPQESPELEEVLAFARRNRVEGGFPAPPSLPPREARESLAFPLKQAIHRSRVENLDVLPGGLLIENPSETLSAQMPRMRTILLHAREEYDVVLLDTPPLSLVHDTAVLSGVVDGVVYVVNSRRYDSELVLRNRTVLDRAGAVVLGAVLNQVEPMGVYKDNKYYYTD